jgi:hypothetical protein
VKRFSARRWRSWRHSQCPAFAVKQTTFPTIPNIESLRALALDHLEVDQDGKPSNRPVRDGLVMDLRLGNRDVKLLNVHLKSSCNASSSWLSEVSSASCVVFADKADATTSQSEQAIS